jgi:uncharacterized protein YabE (DUF348 family)
MFLKRFGFHLSLALIIAGAALFLMGGRRPVLVMAESGSRMLETSALTAGWAALEAGFAPAAGDRLLPAASTWLGDSQTVYYFKALPAHVFLSGSTLPISVLTAERIPANILADVGLKLYPGDRVWSNGELIDPSRPLKNPSEHISLQLMPGSEVTVVREGQSRVFHSSEATLGGALFKAGIPIDPPGVLSIPAETPLRGSLQVSVENARPIFIQVDGNEIAASSSAGNVGQALAGAGYALQGQDYAEPDEYSPIPEDGIIRIVRVREEVVLNETEMPFATSTTADPNTGLDQTSVIQSGRPGLKVTRERVRYEDGREISRAQEAEWTAREPVDERIGYGTKIEIRKLDTPDGQIEYYRALSVYATSYSPCRQGMGKCSLSTASGIPLKKGIVAVKGSWYASLGLTQVYVPGYGFGTIADTGGGIPGKYWIDLGFGEEDFVNWHQQVTVYFLTPVPANVVGILP